MKVTSLKELESYIYSSVILPLSGLDIDPLNFSTPITNDRGFEITFSIMTERVHGDFQHNFQRDDARNRAKKLVIVTVNDMEGFIAADFDRHTKDVTVYRPALREAGCRPFIINKFADAFRRHTAFHKVTMADTMRSADRSVEVPH